MLWRNKDKRQLLCLLISKFTPPNKTKGDSAVAGTRPATALPPLQQNTE